MSFHMSNTLPLTVVPRDLDGRQKTTATERPVSFMARRQLFLFASPFFPLVSYPALFLIPLKTFALSDHYVRFWYPNLDRESRSASCSNSFSNIRLQSVFVWPNSWRLVFSIFFFLLVNWRGPPQRKTVGIILT